MMHAIATLVGAIAAVRFTWGAPLWQSLVVYAAFVFVAHIACVPFMTAWAMMVAAVERWVRSLIEEELIRFDLRTYQHQLARVFPEMEQYDRSDR